MNGLIRRYTDDKFLVIFGHLYFITLVIAAGYFYQERLINFDSAHYTFQIIQKGSFYVIHDRLVSYFTQWIPLLAIKLGFSLKTILILYSAGLMALIYLVYITIAHGIKNIYAATLLVAVFGAMWRYKFYAGISEIIPAIAFGVLFIAVFTRKRQDHSLRGEVKEGIWFFLCGVLMAISHPVPILPVILVYVFWGFYHRKAWTLQFWIKLLVYIFPMIIKYLTIREGSYESKKLGFLDQIIPVLSNSQDFFVYTIMKDYIRVEHWFVWVLFLISIAYLLWERRIWPLIVLVLSAALVMMLNLVTFHYLNNKCYIMIDGYMVFVGIVLCFFICIELLSKDQWRKYLVPLLVIFFVFNLFRIRHARLFFTKRLAYLEETYTKYESEKDRILITQIHHTDWDKIWYPYQYKAETVLHSTLRGKDKTVYMVADEAYCVDIDNANRMNFEEKTEYIPKLDDFGEEKAPNPYFSLPKNSRVRSVEIPSWLTEKQHRDIENWMRDKYKNHLKPERD